MDVLTAIRERRSIRKFLSKEIPPDIVDTLKCALIWAPSAGNLQMRRFYFVYNKDVKKRLVDAALGQTFILEAPLVVVACSNLLINQYYGKRGEELYVFQDAACSIQNMMLAAHSFGLGSVWVGAFHENKVKKILDLPAHLRPVAIVPVGYPNEKPSPPERVDKEEAVVEVR